VVELGGEGLVVREDERGPVAALDDLGHGEGLAGAGDAEEDLVFSPAAMPETSSAMARGWSPWGL
jgi:hypothetical protein